MTVEIAAVFDPVPIGLALVSFAGPVAALADDTAIAANATASPAVLMNFLIRPSMLIM
jgi:hypothetical protein